jgi:hypothetical protein
MARPRANARDPATRPLASMIILDTNVLSELLRPEPARQVERWLADQPV